MTAAVELSPYLLLVVAGFFPNEIWRWLGLGMARGLDEESEFVLLARAIATAILAGVIAKLILFPSGELVGIPLALRVGAAVAGFIAFLAIRRSLLAGVVVGEAVLLIGAFVSGH